ncbi:MAG: response regulator [Nitrospinota bacterium]
MKSKVLIVDDEIKTCEILQNYFQNLFDVDVAYDGQEAMEKVEAFNPDCVLLDIKMPNIDGLQVLKKLKPRFPDIKFIMVTANRSVSKMMDSIMSDAFDYVPKPIQLEELEKKILLALEQPH